MTDFKPMLAKDAVPEKLRFPLVGQIKYDGIRAVVRDGRLVTRTLKEVPNREIFEYMSRPEFEGLDGEIIVGSPTAEGCMQATSSFVMAPNKTGVEWAFYVFDDFTDPSLPFTARYDAALTRLYDGDYSRLTLAANTYLPDAAALEAFEGAALAEGHEGVIVRDPDGDYKFGRSYPKDGRLLKVKRFIDFEAEVIGVYEKMHNANEAVTNLLGRTERSSKQAGMVPMGTLGGLVLRAVNGPCEGIEFRCGTGFDDATRDALWAESRHFAHVDYTRPENPAAGLNGQIAKIKSFPVGVKDKPRFPVFLGWRDMEVDG
jgi:DNA ligase-1